MHLRPFLHIRSIGLGNFNHHCYLNQQTTLGMPKDYYYPWETIIIRFNYHIIWSGRYAIWIRPITNHGIIIITTANRILNKFFLQWVVGSQIQLAFSLFSQDPMVQLKFETEHDRSFDGFVQTLSLQKTQRSFCIIRALPSTGSDCCCALPWWF